MAIRRNLIFVLTTVLCGLKFVEVQNKSESPPINQDSDYGN